jgi:uncharacterized protein (DUF2252 family)
MVTTRVAHPSIDERKAAGQEAGERTPLSAHADWRPAQDRLDPVTVLEEQSKTREPDLVPVRYGRMMVSPLTFYRGTAKIMAADLKGTPVGGLNVQLCGDAHLSNFGVFASPERRLVFDLNDFDETLPGPFEYDVKRMAASFTVAARNNGFSKSDTRESTLASIAAYREAMVDFADMGTMDIWYAHLDEDQLAAAVDSALAEVVGAATTKKPTRKQTKEVDAARKAAKSARKAGEKARTRSSLQALSKLGEVVDGRQRIASRPPIVIPARDLAPSYGVTAEELDLVIRRQFRSYRETLPDDRRHLLDHFEIVDMARNVVGVGSVGTRAFIVLLQGRDPHDPLFLQIKEATASVLEAHLPKSRYRHHGQRVVQGQRMMQATSDIYLGWTRGEEQNRQYYWRQLRDMKGSASVEAMAPVALAFYARTCGWTLARAHARSGDPVAIAEYLGRSDAFDQSIAKFSARYADQNERDYDEFVTSIRTGRIDAIEGV